MESKFVRNIKDQEKILIQGLRDCVEVQKNCLMPDVAIDEFVKIANHYRMVILSQPRDAFLKLDGRRQKNYSMAMDVVDLAELLASKLEVLKVRLTARFSVTEDNLESGAFDCLLWCSCDQGGACICENSIGGHELRRFSKKLQNAVEDIYGMNNIYFEKKIGTIYNDMLFDLLKISFDFGLKVVAYNDVSKYGKNDRSMFHAFVKIFDYCEYSGDVLSFSWRSILSKRGVEYFSSTLAVRLNDIKNGKTELIKGDNFSVERVGLNFYEYIHPIMDCLKIKADLPSFKK